MTTIRCGRARRLLWPDEALRVLDPELEEARAHLEECEACERFIADMRRARERVRVLAPRPEAPPEVRERLFTALARERAALPPAPAKRSSPFGRPGRRGAAIAAAVLGLLATMLVVAVRREDPSLAGVPIAAITEDHIRALQDQAIRTSATDSLSAWLAARVAFAVNVPEIPDVPLEGGRLCLLDGRRSAVLRYRVDGRPVSYYMIPAGLGEEPAADPGRFVHEAEAGYRIVTWRAAGLVHALVGDVPRDRLTEVARSCVQKAVTTSGQEENRPLPDVTLPDLEGRSRRLRERADEVTLLNFWATWCVPCLKELPELVALDDALAERGLHVVGIAIDSGDPADIRTFAAEHEMDYTLLTADHQWARQHFGVMGLPVTLVVDRDGRIRRRMIGPQTGAHFEAAIRPFLTPTENDDG